MTALPPKKKKTQKSTANPKALKSEQAMIAGILEGSPEAIGVAIVRLGCGCRKMAAVDKAGEPASKVIIYRDSAQSVCRQCKADNGALARVAESFIRWAEPAPDEATQHTIRVKVLGSGPAG